MGMPISIEANKDSKYKHSFSFRLLEVSAGEAADSSLLASVSDSCRVKENRNFRNKHRHNIDHETKLKPNDRLTEHQHQ